VPLPTFSRNSAVVILDDVGDYAKLAVTVEPSGGSQAPTTKPFAVASL
jgi:anti-sigma-K factor RskA